MPVSTQYPSQGSELGTVVVLSADETWWDTGPVTRPRSHSRASGGAEIRNPECAPKPGLQALAPAAQRRQIRPADERVGSPDLQSSPRSSALQVFEQEYSRGNSDVAWMEGLNEITFMVSFNPEIHDSKKDGIYFSNTLYLNSLFPSAHPICLGLHE